MNDEVLRPAHRCRGLNFQTSPVLLHSLRKRFDFYVERTATCWLFTGKSSSFDYGLFYVNRKMYLAHRVSWALTHEFLLPGICVLHKCDVPRCVNPDHLFLGSQGDNMRDMRRKGRGFSPGSIYDKR